MLAAGVLTKVAPERLGHTQTSTTIELYTHTIPAMQEDVTIQPCELCGEVVELRGSHVIPNFVYRWLKETSATGYLRTADSPNKRVQEGWVRRMLCAPCEQRFSDWEKTFAEKVFAPHTAGRRPDDERYGPWLFQFALSISWRVLQSNRRLAKLDALPPKELAEIDEALEVWRAFLVGERSNTGRFEQHMLLLGMVDTTDDPDTPGNINRYLTRGVDSTVLCNSRTTFVYVNLCGILLLGFVETMHRHQWKGTRLSPKGGLLSRKYEAPGAINRYIIERAKSFRDVLESLSPRQQAKLDEFLLSNPDVLAQSGSLSGAKPRRRIVRARGVRKRRLREVATQIRGRTARATTRLCAGISAAPE